MRLSRQTHLVKVGQAVGVLAEALVLSSESVSGGDLPELLQVHHVQGAAEAHGEGEQTMK